MKRTFTRAILLSVLLLLGGSLAFACSVVEARRIISRNIRLVVLDGRSTLKQADVFVIRWQSDKPTVVAHSKTDDHGTAEVRNLPVGNYDITSSIWPPYEWKRAVHVAARGGISEVRAEVASPPLKLPKPVFVNAIDGVVVDVAGAVIPNAVFVLERVDEGHTPVAAGQASGDGKLSVKVPSGHYIMRVARPGFETAVVPVFVGAEPDAWASFQLVLKLSPCDFPGMSHDVRPLN